MAEPTQPSSAIPVAPILQRQRAEIRVELDIAGASMTAISQVDELVDSIIAETLIVTAAELLRSDAPSVSQSLARAEHRLLPNSYRSPEELLSRVTGDMATRSAAEASYQRLRDLLSGRSRVQPPPPPAPRPTVLPLTTPAIRAAFPPAPTKIRREAKTVLLAVISLILLLLLAVMAFRSFTQKPHFQQIGPTPAHSQNAQP